MTKTYKLFINGAFPRSESGRSLPVSDPKGAVLAHVAHGSRKDLRDAVVAARKAQPGWAGRTPYNRGQIVYRMAEMLEGKAAEFEQAIADPTKITPAAARREVAAAVDLLVAYAGWADKFQQVLGTHNPVAGPYHNFAIPEPSGVVAAIAPEEPALLALLALLLPPLVAGNAVVAVASTVNPLPAAVLGEVLATSDLPPGVVNLITTESVGELADHIADHRDIDAVHAGDLGDPAVATTLRLGAAQNIKRVTIHADLAPRDYFDQARMASPWMIQPFVEIKALWHPAAT